MVPRETIIAEAQAAHRALLRRLDPDSHSLGGTCLYAAWSVRLALAANDLPARVAAGSMSWPRLLPAEDDGVVATHFSFCFDPCDLEPRVVYGAVSLPECHLWVVCGEDVVDVTTGTFPFLCAVTAGLPWTAPVPPDYLWGVPPPGVVYTEPPRATRMAQALVNALDRDLLGKSV